MDHKYVNHSGLGFVLWLRTDDIWHSHVGSLLKRVDGQIVSAGFARIVDGKVLCFGRSETLGIDSAEGDSANLAQQLGLSQS